MLWSDSYTSRYDDLVAHPLAEKHRLAGPVAQPREHRAGAFVKRVVPGDLGDLLEHAAGRIESPFRAHRIDETAGLQSAQEFETAGQGPTERPGDLGQAERRLELGEGLEQIEGAGSRFHKHDICFSYAKTKVKGR